MDNNYIVSARKYRPTTFSSVVGQKNLTATLRNAIATDRLAHSYLFCGSRGVGKTSCARIFAKTINCEHRTPQGDPCNECASCKAFNEGRSFNIIELDAASNNGVTDIRNLTEQVMVPPTEGKYRVFIIDEVHMLSAQAFNAFLKTLEEPPSYIIFILATTEKHKILPTILSRCQIYDFNRITVNDIVDHLEHVAQAEGVTADRKALSVIASQADGAMRDALSIFDQIVASSKGNVTYENTIENLSILDNKYYIKLMDAFAKSDVGEALLIFKEIRERGFNTLFFINGLQSFIRDLMVARDPRTLSLLDATNEEKQQMAEIAGRFTPEFYFMALSLINDADMKYREASNKTFLTELLLIKLCQLLSPSPVFRGKEEGHIDLLQPLETLTYIEPDTTVKGKNSETVAAPQVDETKNVQKATNTPGHIRRVKPVGVKVMSINVKKNDSQKTPEPDSNEPEAHHIKQIDPSAILEAWKGYASTVPEKKLVVNTMKGLTPEVDNNDRIKLKVTVLNDVQHGILEEERGAIEKYIEQLCGAEVPIVITTAQGDVIAPIMWSEKEVLDNMLQMHPEMQNFIHDLDLRLS